MIDWNAFKFLLKIIFISYFVALYRVRQRNTPLEKEGK